MREPEEPAAPGTDDEDEAIDLECEESDVEEDGEPREEPQHPRCLISLCALCDQPLGLWTVGTADAAVALQTLILTERLSLLCDVCAVQTGLEDGE